MATFNIPDDVLKEFTDSLYKDGVGPTLSSVHVNSPIGAIPPLTNKLPKKKKKIYKAGTGVMVAWFPPMNIAKQIVVPGGETIDDLHVTLGYFGKDLTEDQVDLIADVLETLTQKYAPMLGSLGGVARFPANPSTEGRDVIVLLADIPYLENLRVEMTKVLDAQGVAVLRNHGFTPHMTIKYIAPEEMITPDESNQSIPVTIDALTLAVAGERDAYPFMGGEVIKSKQDAPMYRKADRDTCNQCIHGGDGYCDLYHFNYEKGYTCNSFVKMVRIYDKYTPPVPVQTNASRAVMQWRSDLLTPDRGSESVMTLASDLANGVPVSVDQIKFIKDFLTANYETSNKLSWNAHGAEWQEWFGLGGRAGLSWAKKCLKIIDTTSKRIEDFFVEGFMDSVPVKLTAKITKIDDDQHLVFGWASIAQKNGDTLVDRQGDTLTDDEMEKAAHDFVLNARIAGEMHTNTNGVGKLVESMVFTKEKQAALGIDLGKTGWFVGFKIDDGNVWKKIKSGEYSMFSIHGRGLRNEVK